MCSGGRSAPRAGKPVLTRAARAFACTACEATGEIPAQNGLYVLDKGWVPPRASMRRPSCRKQDASKPVRPRDFVVSRFCGAVFTLGVFIEYAFVGLPSG